MYESYRVCEGYRSLPATTCHGFLLSSMRISEANMSWSVMDSEARLLQFWETTEVQNSTAIHFNTRSHRVSHKKNKVLESYNMHYVGVDNGHFLKMLRKTLYKRIILRIISQTKTITDGTLCEKDMYIYFWTT